MRQVFESKRGFPSSSASGECLMSIAKARIWKLILGLCSLTFACPAFAPPSWLGGNIINVTSVSGGLMIILDTGLPDNCLGTPYGWMKIPETSKTMIAVTLLARIQNVPVVVYTDGMDSSGFCVINQVDPYF
jgi:hypothetical protein